MPISDYRILQERPENLAVATTGLLADGWQPFGTPIMYQGFVYQAMVKGDVGGSGSSGVELPDEATTAELQAGTETEPRLISPKQLADEIDRRIAAAAE